MDKRINLRIFTDSGNGNFELHQGNEFEFATKGDIIFGENKHQDAEFFTSPEMIDYEILDNRELSYNDIINSLIAVNIVSEFYDVDAVAIVKSNTPCGVALGSSSEEAYNKAFDCNPMAAFFGVAAFSKLVDFETAKHISSMSMQVVISPEFEPKAVELLLKNPDLKLVKLNIPLKEFRKYTQKEVHITPFGTLVQDSNRAELSKNSFNIVTKTKPTAEQIEDGVFAWKISKYSKSNSVVVAKDFKTVAISQGFLNYVDAVENAMDISCDNSKGAIMVTDGSIPTIDCINAAAQGRISLIIQSGGALRDREIISLADKFGISMIFTGIENYRN